MITLSDIDFWTTRCTRCPAALDRLNEMAADPAYGNVHFVAIVCDSLDGARNIIEQDDEPRWANLQHYFMSQADKERAKKILGFHSVPFYVVVNERGVICQKGNKVDWDTIPGFIRSDDSDKENDIPVEESIQGKQIDIERLEQREFVLDDLDF